MRLLEKRAYIGSLDQLVRVTPYRMEEGRAHGVRVVDVYNETGLRMTVLADRCMDIVDLSFRGVNIGYRNACGVVAPAYYDAVGNGWLRGFTAGFLTTCGLCNIGAPCVTDGIEHGQHGRISYTPAREFSARVESNENEARAILSGTMNESVMFGENLDLCRKITMEGTKNQITIRDRICNRGFRKESYMQLYHFNLGYPFLSEDCELYLPHDAPTPRDAWAAAHIKEVAQIESPRQTQEMCYYYTLPPQGDTAYTGIFNRVLGIGLIMTFDKKPLKCFTQWKNLSQGAYVLGLEPGTNFVEGRDREQKRSGLPTLDPQSWEEHCVQIEFFENRDAFLKKWKERNFEC